MRSKKLQNMIMLFASILLGIAISSCNSNAGSGITTSSTENVMQKINKLKSGVGIAYTLDGEALNAGTQNWGDMGWHLLTLTLTNPPVPQQSIPVNGISATIGSIDQNPEYGESVVVQDINCDKAVFANAGDHCSAYIKVNYDYQTYNNINPVVSVNIYPNNWQSLPTIIQVQDWIKPAMAIGVYRPVHAFEQQYYSGSQVASNPNQYRILLMQNGLIKPINVTSIAIPSDGQIFQLIHRSIAGNDPYYGNNSECSVTANSGLNQVSSLRTTNASCIVVYKATEYTTQADIYDNIYVGSSADSVFPRYAGNYKLHAHYAVAVPIPNQGFNTTKGSFSTPQPINQFNISYNFTPTKLPILGGSTGANLILPNGTNVWNGEPILTNLSSSSYITSINQQFPDGEATHNDGQVGPMSCGGGWTWGAGQVYQTHSLTEQGQFNIALQLNSSSNCGSPAPQNFNLNIPFSGYNQQIYANDQQGCGGKNWDMGGYATLSGSCNGSWCNYQLAITATHGGVGGQCHASQTSYIPLSFPQPTTNIVANLNGNNAPITFAAHGGQTTTGAIGSQSGAVAQSLSCDDSGTCNISGDYSNGQSALGMGYQINLNSGDVLNHGLIQFTRSSGYQLNSFAIEQNN